MNKNDWNFTFPDSLLQTMAELNKIQLSTSSLAMTSAMKAAVPDTNLSGISAAMREYTAFSRSFSGITISTNALLGLTDAINALPTLKLNSVVESIIPLIDTSACAVLKDTSALAALTKIDWSWMSDVRDEYSDGQSELNDGDMAEDVTPEICAEIAADVSQVLSNPGQAQELSKSKYEKWKERHPFLADLYMQVFLPLLKEAIQSLIVAGMAIVIASPSKDPQVAETSVQSQSVVYNITVEQKITVVGEQQDYYVVEFIDPNTGETVKGYISKGGQDSEKVTEATVALEEESVIEVSESETTVTSAPAEPSE